ncbi:hypothetical protein [Parasedimentitalea psychrophila]|uniref:Uncharacterized protein n=1 Tax=Parasedimentitalea psychrophila TaxID=2997337 RepID=A0A9Y2P3I7_9RHOB|nr:hypothetical protein [Parasedimentitalea psychrophila]WIY27706.1 hypothetical protein QPJ95_23510 [Parasedimentitalea psychrophila]
MAAAAKQSNEIPSRDSVKPNSKAGRGLPTAPSFVEGLDASSLGDAVANTTWVHEEAVGRWHPSHHQSRDRRKTIGVIMVATAHFGENMPPFGGSQIGELAPY